MSKIRSSISVGLLSLLVATPVLAQSDTAPRWSYDGDQDGQEAWGRLSHLYATCELGTQQSPINITSTKPSYKPPLEFHYKTGQAAATFENLALTVHMQDAMELSSETHAYTLASIAFHSPSEHVVKQKFYPMEIELLHKDKEGNQLILSVFVEFGEANAAIAAILENPSARFDPSLLLPPKRGYYAYLGSLTTPPCTENVEWRILKQPITMAKEQMAAIGRMTNRNARLTQPVYMREVEETGE